MNIYKIRVGYTLVELLVVISIIAIVAAITFPAFNSYSANRDQNTCMNNLRKLGVALIEYRDDYGKYPAAPLPAFLASEGLYASNIPLIEQGAYYLPFSAPIANPKPSFTGGTETPLVVDVVDYSVPEDRTYKIIIEDTANRFTSQYSTDGGDTWSPKSAPVDITPDTPQPVQDGVTVTFDADTHTINDTWTFNVTTVPEDWYEWHPLFTATSLSGSVGIGAMNISVSNDLNINAGDILELAGGGMVERVLVKKEPTGGPIDLLWPTRNAFNSATITNVSYKRDLVNPGEYARVPVGNFGLATLYHQYLEDKKDYVTGYAGYRCPAMKDREDVNRLEVLGVTTAAKEFRTFDPLWSGFNTYDVRYNYDQFHNGVLAFEAQLGVPGLHTARQLKNADAPPDTVVTWCDAHRSPRTTTWPLQPVDGTTPVVPGAPALKIIDPASVTISDPKYADVPQRLLDKVLDELESGGGTSLGSSWKIPKSLVDQLNDADHPMSPDFSGGMYYGMKSDVVLCLDGTVTNQTQRLMRGPDVIETGITYRTYYWVPPYLYARGDWR